MAADKKAVEAEEAKEVGVDMEEKAVAVVTV